MMTILEAAKLLNITRQAVYVAVKQKKIRALKCAYQWKISNSDVLEYIKNRYSRKTSVINGELVFDKSKGEYSVTETACLLHVPNNFVYYSIQSRGLKHKRKAAAYVIHIDDIKEFSQRMGISVNL